MGFFNLWKSGGAVLASAWLVAACSSGDGGGNSGGAGSANAGTNATAGSAGAALGGGGASSAGSGSAGGGASSGASGVGGSAVAPTCLGPKRDFTKSPHACVQNHSFPTFPWDYDLATATVAGQPYAIEIDLVGTVAPTVVIWGGTTECPDQAEPVLQQVLAPGQYCLVLHPTAAYTHLVVGLTGTTDDSGEQVRGVCGNGSCPQ